MTEVTKITPELLATLSTDALINDWCYSDAHKDVYGFRPRGEFTRERVVSFWLGFEAAWDDMKAEEQRELDYLRAEHNIHFASMHEYYVWWEKKEYARWIAQLEADERLEAERLAKELDYKRRRTIIDTIEDFLHGSFKGAIA